MYITTFLLDGLNLLSAAFTRPLIHEGDADNNVLLFSRSRWPKQLFPRIRLMRYSGCKHNSTSAVAIWTHDIRVEHCHDFSLWLIDIEKEKEKLLNDLRYDPLVTAADIDRAEHPEDYLTEALYWQLPPEQTKNLIKPIQRCNITIFSELGCKPGSRVVKFTDEQSDVCIPAHKGKSIWVDCYTERELAALEKNGRGPPKHWKASGILRYGPGNHTHYQEQYLMPPYEVNLNKTYDAQSEEWLRTCEGRKATHKALMKDKMRACAKNMWDPCTDTVFASTPYIGDYLWAGKC